MFFQVENKSLTNQITMNRADFVRQKYQLDRQTFIEQKIDGKALGAGPVMSEECFQKFVESDPSGNGKYLDWMLYMAGGGHDAAVKAQILWDGESATDEHSLLNILHKEYVEERTAGYEDSLTRKKVPAVVREVAEADWTKKQAEIKAEFYLGDQDLACEDGFGFYRNWPGKDNHYANIVAYVRNWDASIAKFRAQNASIAARMAKAVKLGAPDPDSADEPEERDPSATVIELDIYKGWKLESLLQPAAVYNNLAKLTAVLNGRVRDTALADTRHEIVFENEHVTAVCPYTIGASVKFGHYRWCTSSKSDFDRAMQNQGAITGGNWATFASKGPLVYIRFKQPMPPYYSMLAAHHTSEGRKGRLKGEKIDWYDLRNERNQLSPEIILRAIENGHIQESATMEAVADGREEAPINQVNQASDGAALRTPGWKPGQTTPWNSADDSRAIASSFRQLLDTMSKWAAHFDMNKIETTPKIPDVSQLPVS